MLSAVARHWFSSDFAIQDAAHQHVTEVKVSPWRSRGAISVAGLEYKVTDQWPLTFVLERGGSVLARAQKLVLRSTFKIEHGGKQYLLKARSAWGRERVLYDEHTELGSVAWKGAFPFATRARIGIELPDDLPLVLRLFVVWLLVVEAASELL